MRKPDWEQGLSKIALSRRLGVGRGTIHRGLRPGQVERAVSAAGARPSNDRLRGAGVRRRASESSRASGLSASGRVARRLPGQREPVAVARDPAPPPADRKPRRLAVPARLAALAAGEFSSASKERASRLPAETSWSRAAARSPAAGLLLTLLGALCVLAPVLLLPVAAEAQTEVWSGTLTVRNSVGLLGCSNGYPPNLCSVNLSDDDFTHDSTDYAIKTLWVRTNGKLELAFDTDLTTATQALTLNLDGTAFAFEDADAKTARGRNWDNSGLSWTVNDTVSATLTEGTTTLSTDATLSALALSGVTLAPAFVSTTETYTGTVGNAVTETTVTATVTHSGATVAFKDGDDNALTNPVTLAVGANVIKAVVTAEDTTTIKTYMVTVTREATATTVPGAPTGLTATASGTSTINLTWTAPSNDGGSAISGYRIEVSSDGGSSWITLVDDTDDTNTTYEDHFPAGTTRHYRVSAINSVGTGAASNVATLTVPGAPTSLTATASGTNTINLTWTAPSNDGGSAISGYRIEISSDGGSSWINLVVDTDDTNTTYEDRQPAGTTRHYRVSAINSVGTGAASNVDDATTATASTCLAPNLAGRTQIWTGTVTVEVLDLAGTPVAYGFGTGFGALDPTQFSVGMNDYTVDAVNVDASTSTTPGRLAFSLTGALATADSVGLTLHVCDAAFALADATFESTLHTYNWDDAGLDWSSETTRTLYLSVPSNDTTAPSPSSATVASNGITVNVDFDEALALPDTAVTSAFTLTADGVALDIDNFSWGAATLIFDVASGTKIYAGQTVRLSYDKTVAGDDALEDAAGNEVASFTDFAVTNNSTVTTTTAPAIVTDGVQVTSTPMATGDTYGLDETIAITVTFDNAVTVDTSGGTPRIQFRLGPPRDDRWAEYSSGSGGTALVFTYTVQSSDTDDDGIWLPDNFLRLRSGTITAAVDDTVDATLTYAEPGLQTGHKVDGSLTDNADPTFDDDSTSRAFDETIGDVAVSTAAGIGTPVEATDTNPGDTLTYSLEGTDVARFGIVTTSGQLQTKVGEQYSYEAKTSYAVTVKVVDDNGGSDTIAVTIDVNDVNEPPARPAAPSVSSDSTTSLLVTWTAPENTGRPDIANYDLRYRQGTNGGWTNDPQNVSGPSATITNLTAAPTTYQVQVRATNNEGDGEWSLPGRIRPPPPEPDPVGPPTTPSALTATAGDQAVELSWRRPADDGGAQIVRYEYRQQDGDGPFGAWQIIGADPPPTTHRVTGLMNGTRYTFQVRAVNASGPGPAAAVTVTPVTTPGVPQQLKGVPGDGQVTLTWEAPSSDGGAAITGYQYELDKSGTWRDAALDLEATVTGLTDGQAYAFAVRAVNAIDPGPAATVTVTVPLKHSDRLLRAWLSRFGRTVATHVTDTVGERLREPVAPASHVTIGGYRLPLGQAAPGRADSATQEPETPMEPETPTKPEPPMARLASLLTDLVGRVLGLGPTPSPGGSPWAAPPEVDPRLGAAQALGLPTFRLRDVLRGSSFRLTLGATDEAGAHPRLTAWGRVAGTQFDGRDGTVTLDGNVLTGAVGVDRAWDRWLAGVAVSHSLGDGAFSITGDGGDGALDSSTLTSIHPYLRYAVNDRVEVWSVLGYGWGEMTLAPETGGALETDTTLMMGSFGGRGILLSATDTAGFEVAARTDAMLTRTTSGAVAGLAAADVAAHRVRLVLEGARPVLWPEGQSVTPSMTLGLRHDWGDAETGFGLELGGRVQYADPNHGLTMEAAVRGLLAHEDSDYKEWGASGTIRIDPGPMGQGLALTLSPTWGAASSGVENLWSRQTTAGLAPQGRTPAQAGQLHAQVGYGLWVPSTGGLVTPFTAVTVAGQGGSRSRVGLVFDRPGTWGTGLRVELAGERIATAAGPPEHTIGLQLQFLFGSSGKGPRADDRRGRESRARPGRAGSPVDPVGTGPQTSTPMVTPAAAGLL